MLGEEVLIKAVAYHIWITSVHLLLAQKKSSFASYEARKIIRLAKCYPKDIATYLVRLESQLGAFIDDMRNNDRFKYLKYSYELSIKLVETQKHVLYDLVYLLLKLFGCVHQSMQKPGWSPISKKNFSSCYWSYRFLKRVLKESFTQRA